ncbi:uncharacterized protein [Dysidea avara]|uniref:uncharacterized protein n=1 Tax=Dysidea avara TaxID=196820 RepID=UPI00332919EE
MVMMMGPGLTLVVTANIVFTTLGLFEHKVFFDESSTSLRLIEGGVGRNSLAMFTMEGKRKIFGSDDCTPSIFYREENNIKYYITLIKAKSGDSYKLALTKNENQATTFLVKSIDTHGKVYSVYYEDEETGTRLCLQGAFPKTDGHTDYNHVHAKLGDCFTTRHKDTHIIPLLANIRPKKGTQCL